METEVKEPEKITAQQVESKPEKIKDPRRVAAGKALAARNKAAREAKKQQTQQQEQGEKVGFDVNSVLQVAALVGAGFTLYHGYQVVKPYLSQNSKQEYFRPVHTRIDPKKPATPVKEEQKNEIKGIDMEEMKSKNSCKKLESINDTTFTMSQEEIVRVSVNAAVIATIETLVLVRVLFAFIDYALKPK